jgi:Fis family transcriptional regulator
VNAKTGKKKASKPGKKKLKANEKLALRNKPLHAYAEDAIKGYFHTLNGHKPRELHQFVLAQVERPLLEMTMDYTNGNQSAAAEILGLSRGTLRKRLQTYKLL